MITQFQIAGLFNKAYGKAATVQNGCPGFQSTGIWPNYLYEPAESTSIPLENIPSEQGQQQILYDTVPMLDNLLINKTIAF